MANTSEFVEEAGRRAPVMKSADVVVAGGGPAGFAAALAAAREGADKGLSVLLVERFGYLGGMITGSAVPWILGVGDGAAPKARGVTAELRRRFEPLGGVTGVGKSGDYRVDMEIFKWQAVEMLQEAGAEILLHTVVCDPIIEGGRAAGVFVETKKGRRAIRAKVIVDATADADVAFRMGCACEDQTHDVTLRIVIEGVDKDKVAAFRAAQPDRYAAITQEAARLNNGVMPGANVKLKDVDVADPEALTRADFQMRRGVFAALEYLRGQLPGYEKARVAGTGDQIGVRQGRRVRGVYTLTDDDLRASRHFDDGVARLGAYLVGYKGYGVPGLDYDVPYRCLVPEKADGLLIAGRCVSADYLAGNTLRLIVPCFATGQAAGVAAAVSVKEGVAPRHIPIDRLRAALRKQDVYIGP